MKQVCFSHGQESGPWGTKIQALAKVARALGWHAEALDYQGIASATDRVAVLLDHCRQRDPDDPTVLVGSSMGGYVAMAAASEYPAAGLFLLAPALYISGYQEILPPAPECPTTIIHGWGDDVVPCEGSIRYGNENHSQLILVDGDHRLTGNLDQIAWYFQQFLKDVESTEVSS